MKYNFQKQVRPSDAPVQGSIEAKKKFEQEVRAIGPMIHQFRVDVQRFFAGDLPLPPEELREKIARNIRRMQTSKEASSATLFQLNTFEAQFNSQVELYNRRMREREMGGPRRRPAGAPAPEHDAREGVVFGKDGAVEALYKGLYMRGGKPSSNMDLERFRGHLSKQAEAIRAKTGASNIQFRIAEEDGKLKIKARAIREKG